MKHKGLKIFSFTAMVIFNLFICFVATFSWFTAARKNNASDMAVRLEANELKLDYELLKFDEDTKQIIETEHFNLNKYDSIIKERNIHTTMIIKAILSGNILDNQANSDVNIKLSCTSGSAYDDVLSNIIHFKFKSFHIDSDNITEIYNQAKTTLESETATTFITTVKNTEVNLTISQANIINGQITVYGLIDYDEALIDSRPAFTLDEVPTFTNDLQYIRYSIHE